jgi:hypothetical protein
MLRVTDSIMPLAHIYNCFVGNSAEYPCTAVAPYNSAGAFRPSGEFSLTALGIICIPPEFIAAVGAAFARRKKKKARASEAIAITASGTPTAMPTVVLADRPVEETSVANDVSVVDEKLCNVGEELCVVVGEELCAVVDDGKSQPFTWIPFTTDSVCTVEVDMTQEEIGYVANSTTSPGLTFEMHSPALPAPSKLTNE